jgi:quinol-cytochrome oxidoreductase complex cytochrome b subunit
MNEIIGGTAKSDTMTLRIMTFNIMTLSILILTIMALRITINETRHSA